MSTYPFDQPPPQDHTQQPPSEPARDLGWASQPAGQGATQQQQRVAVPAVDIYDTPEEIWVSVDLPGFEREQIHVRCDQNALLIAAERAEEFEEGRTPILTERPTRVERTIPLQWAVDVPAADATYEDGVCRITLPKNAAQRYEEIDVHSP